MLLDWSSLCNGLAMGHLLLCSGYHARYPPNRPSTDRHLVVTITLSKKITTMTAMCTTSRAPITHCDGGMTDGNLPCDGMDSITDKAKINHLDASDRPTGSFHQGRQTDCLLDCTVQDEATQRNHLRNHDDKRRQCHYGGNEMKHTLTHTQGGPGPVWKQTKECVIQKLDRSNQSMYKETRILEINTALFGEDEGHCSVLFSVPAL